MNNLMLAKILRETMEDARRGSISAETAVKVITERCAAEIAADNIHSVGDYKDMFLALSADQ